LFPSAAEREMVAAAGLPHFLVPVAGVLEVAFAAVTLAGWRWRPLFLWNVLAMAVALGGVALNSPGYLVAAFNPVTLNAGMILLSAIGYLASVDLPSASRCLRRAPGGTV
jgi:DoxX-like family